MSPVPICFRLITLTPFVLPLTFQPAYISLVCHVCFLSSYINFKLLSTCVWLKFLSSLLLVSLSGSYPWTSNLCLSTSSVSKSYFHGTFQLHAFWKPSRSTQHLPVSKIPGLWQKASAVHELKPLSRPPITSGNLWDPIYMSGSLGLTHNSIYELTAFRFVYAMAGNPMHQLQLSMHRKNPSCTNSNTNTTIPTSIYFQSTWHVYNHQYTPGPSTNPPQLTNPSTGSSSTPNAVPATRNPQNLKVTTIVNTIKLSMIYSSRRLFPATQKFKPNFCYCPMTVPLLGVWTMGNTVY